MAEHDENTMPVLGHLAELRKRLIISLVAVVVTTTVSIFFSDSILRFLLQPLKNVHLKAFSLMDGFMIKWRISLFTGIVVAFPIWAFEIYAFLKPALHKEERESAWPFLVGAFGLFLIGMAFAYYSLFSMVTALLGFFPLEIEFLPSADDYLSFVIFFMLACGVVFELPPVLAILVKLRILKTTVLRKQRRIAYFILFAFAEIITPVSDPIVAPLTVMCPLIVLYEISLLWGRRIERKRERSEAVMAMSPS